MSVVGSGERWLLMDCSSKFMQFQVKVRAGRRRMLHDYSVIFA